MPEQVQRLMLEFLAWVSAHPRTYAQTMDAWKSSCPRHPVWEDALSAGFVEIEMAPASVVDQSRVDLTAKGRSFLTNPPRA
jgi:hypothetical protein